MIVARLQAQIIAGFMAIGGGLIVAIYGFLVIGLYRPLPATSISPGAGIIAAMSGFISEVAGGTAMRSVWIFMRPPDLIGVFLCCQRHTGLRDATIVGLITLRAVGVFIRINRCTKT